MVNKNMTYINFMDDLNYNSELAAKFVLILMNASLLNALSMLFTTDRDH